MPVIELQIDAASLPRLLRSTVLTTHRAGRARTTVCPRIWHDTPAGHLREHGLALSEQAGLWRLERLATDPATPPLILAEGTDQAQLHRRLTPPMLAALTPVAAFTGSRRSLPLDLGGQAARLDIVEGALRGVARDQPACRLILSGPPPSTHPTPKSPPAPGLASLASQLGAQLPLMVPPCSLAASAIAVGLGVAAAPGRLGAPEIPPGATVAEALGLVITHLTRVLLHWAGPIATVVPGQDTEPVHQMRVAVRRLRSALAVFRRASGGPEGAALFRTIGSELKTLAAVLGAARDWDVFLAGDGHAIGQAFADDKRVGTLLAAASRKRTAAYAAVAAQLASPGWARLALRLALLPIAAPWQPPSGPHPPRDEYGEVLPTEDQANLLAAPAEAFAAHALQRRFKRVAGAGEDVSALPPDAMHDARKLAKRLRYACEFFAPLFPPKPVRRFLERLEDVQEALGAVNDGHVAAALMEQIAGSGEARFANGVVQGYVAASRAPSARRAGRAWTKLLEQPVFWE